jgi:hypothetical protein
MPSPPPARIRGACSSVVRHYVSVHKHREVLFLSTSVDECLCLLHEELMNLGLTDGDFIAAQGLHSEWVFFPQNESPVHGDGRDRPKLLPLELDLMLLLVADFQLKERSHFIDEKVVDTPERVGAATVPSYSQSGKRTLSPRTSERVTESSRMRGWTRNPEAVLGSDG